MKRKFLSFSVIFALILSSVFSLFSCGEKYEPVESTEEEERTVIEISYDGEEYEIAYELYRAFFLELKSEVDGGDNSVWTGAEKDKYVKAIDELIYHRLSEIYAVFHLCQKADIDVYSDEYDEKIQEHIVAAVEGGVVDGVSYEGFGGDYNKYLESLKKMNLNYSAQALLIRYQLAYEDLFSYYVGSSVEDLTPDSQSGSIKFTKEDVKNFYLNENESRKIMIAFFDSAYFTKTLAQEKRDKIASKNTDKEVSDYIGSLNGNPTVEVIGTRTYDKFYYSEFTEAAFSLSVGQTSELIMLNTDSFDGYVVIYRLNAAEDDFNKDYESIKTAFLYDRFGKIVDATAKNITSSFSPTDTLKQLDRSKVSMD